MRTFTLRLVVPLTLLALGSNSNAAVVFSDTFEYAVGRTDTNAVSTFVSRGWYNAKTQQTSPNANGYLYTVTSIPGVSGSFPGNGSSRALAIEALPGTLGGQTDFYLQLGAGFSAAYDDYIPGNVWFQFWIYSASTGNQQSTYGTRNKFLYVCRTDYPCSNHLWLISQGALTYDPSDWSPLGSPSQGEFFWNLSGASGQSNIDNSLGDPDTRGTIGSSDRTEWVTPNRWTLVKMHMNTTATSGNSWEVWLRPYGGSWTKVSEWIGGQTPGFTWNIPSGNVGGHRVLRIPTTVGTPSGQSYDYWMYMDDFIIATTEQDLPDYPDARPGPRSPTNLRAD